WSHPRSRNTVELTRGARWSSGGPAEAAVGKPVHFSDQTRFGQGSGPALCRIRHNDFYRLPAFIISVIPVLNGGGFCPIALPDEKHTYAQCCRGAELGLDRMLVNAAAVLLAAACTSLPTGRKRLLAKTWETDTCRRWLPLFIVGQK